MKPALTMKKPFKIIVHGGAWDIPVSAHKNHIQGVRSALEKGMALLAGGASAVAAVIETVKILETDPTFDAGRGSFLNRDGEVEMDAMVMDGRDLSFGSVGAITHVFHPVEVAERVRTRSEFNFLVGKGATAFAVENGVRLCKTEDLLVGRELELYHELKKYPRHAKTFFSEPKPSDTVGCVALDMQGNIAAATSTGGTPNKAPGRIGDSPIIGAGGYADNSSGAASTTGWGESIMQVLLAKTAIDLLIENKCAQSAADGCIQILKKKVDGRGGVILISASGEAAFAYNTPYMARAIADQSGILHVGI